MLFRNRIVRIDYQQTLDGQFGPVYVKPDGVIYLPVKSGTSLSDILAYLRHNWYEKVIKTGALRRSAKTSARKICINNPKAIKMKGHQKHNPKTKYHNNYPANKARIIYCPM